MNHSTLPVRVAAALLLPALALADETVRTLPAGPDESVTLYEGMSDPYAPSAGSQGFSDGPTAERAARAFARLDRDGDGTLQIAEAGPAPGLERNFAGYDVNRDGVLAANEFQSWYAADGQFDERGLAARDEWDD